MPGYRDTQVYPLTPDLAKARRLAAAYRGSKVVLYTCAAYPCPEQAQIVRTDLAAIGLDVQIRTFGSNSLFNLEANPHAHFDMAWEGWIPDWLDPGAMLGVLLESSAASPSFMDPKVGAELDAADRLSGSERLIAYGKLDLKTARLEAPLAAFGNLSQHNFFSARIGCQTYGFYGMDLGALCTRER